LVAEAAGILGGLDYGVAQDCCCIASIEVGSAGKIDVGTA
jgi:hypothetical protein